MNFMCPLSLPFFSRVTAWWSEEQSSQAEGDSMVGQAEGEGGFRQQEGGGDR